MSTEKNTPTTSTVSTATSSQNLARVYATYVLSKAGQKKAILDGENAERKQFIEQFVEPKDIEKYMDYLIIQNDGSLEVSSNTIRNIKPNQYFLQNYKVNNLNVNSIKEILEEHKSPAYTEITKRYNRIFLHSLFQQISEEVPHFYSYSRESLDSKNIDNYKHVIPGKIYRLASKIEHTGFEEKFVSVLDLLDYIKTIDDYNKEQLNSIKEEVAKLNQKAVKFWEQQIFAYKDEYDRKEQERVQKDKEWQQKVEEFTQEWINNYASELLQKRYAEDYEYVSLLRQEVVAYLLSSQKLADNGIEPENITLKSYGSVEDNLENREKPSLEDFYFKEKLEKILSSYNVRFEVYIMHDKYNRIPAYNIDFKYYDMDLSIDYVVYNKSLD